MSGERTTSCVACASVPDLDGGVVRLRVVVLLHRAEEQKNGACTANSGTPRLSYDGGEDFPGSPAYIVDRPS